MDLHFYKGFTDTIPGYDGVRVAGLRTAYVYVNDWRFYEAGVESDVAFLMVEVVVPPGYRVPLGYRVSLHVYPAAPGDRLGARCWDTGTVVKAEGQVRSTIPDAYVSMLADAGGKLTAKARDVDAARRADEKAWSTEPVEMSPDRKPVNSG
jgi:hypothetical protein